MEPIGGYYQEIESLAHMSQSSDGLGNPNCFLSTRYCLNHRERLLQ